MPESPLIPGLSYKIHNYINQLTFHLRIGRGGRYLPVAQNIQAGFTQIQCTTKMLIPFFNKLIQIFLNHNP